MIKTAFDVAPESNVTLIGFKETVGLEVLLVDMESLRLMTPEKPPTLVSVIVLVPDDPWTMLIDVELDCI